LAISCGIDPTGQEFCR